MEGGHKIADVDNTLYHNQTIKSTKKETINNNNKKK